MESSTVVAVSALAPIIFHFILSFLIFPFQTSIHHPTRAMSPKSKYKSAQPNERKLRLYAWYENKVLSALGYKLSHSPEHRESPHVDFGFAGDSFTGGQFLKRAVSPRIPLESSLSQPMQGADKEEPEQRHEREREEAKDRNAPNVQQQPGRSGGCGQEIWSISQLAELSPPVAMDELSSRLEALFGLMRRLEVDIKRMEVEVAELIEEQEDMRPRRRRELSRTQWERASELRKVRLARISKKAEGIRQWERRKATRKMDELKVRDSIIVMDDAQNPLFF